MNKFGHWKASHLVNYNDGLNHQPDLRRRLSIHRYKHMMYETGDGRSRIRCPRSFYTFPKDKLDTHVNCRCTAGRVKVYGFLFSPYPFINSIWIYVYFNVYELIIPDRVPQTVNGFVLEIALKIYWQFYSSFFTNKLPQIDVVFFEISYLGVFNEINVNKI